jgi:gas vesicle protein
MPWAVTGAEIGLAGAAIEALIHPFFVGAAINRGELDDIPPMPNIGHHAIYGLRRGFDHVINLRRDFQEGGGWQEFSSNLAVFGSGGSVLGLLGGMGVDAMATANTSTEFMPIESSLAGIAVGALVGGYTAVEVTAGEGRRIRREDEGLTTLRRLLRKKRREPEAVRQEVSRQVPVLTPTGEELVQKMKQAHDPSSERAQHLGQDLRTLLAQQQSESSQDSPS